MSKPATPKPGHADQWKPGTGRMAVTFRVTSVKGDVITNRGALQLSSSAGFVTLQSIALIHTAGTASTREEATAVPTGTRITDLLAFTGGKNRIKQNGTWKNAKVALATSPPWAIPPR